MNRSIWMAKLGACVLTVAIGLGSSLQGTLVTAQADSLARPAMLSPLIGTWRGRGKGTAGPGSKPEPVNCRARYRWVEAPNDRLEGIITCAASSAKSKVSIYIGHDPKSGRFGGTYIQKWGTSDVQEFGTFKGEQGDARHFAFQIVVAGRPRAELRFDLRSDSRHSAEVIDLYDNKGLKIFDVTFSR